MIGKILEIKKALGHKPVIFYCVEDIDLAKYTKNDYENQMKYPKTRSNQLDLKGFMSFIENKDKETEDNIKNTETIITVGGEKVNEDSFEILRTLGKGYIGKVFLVEKKDTKKLYALKVISKLDVIKRNFFESLTYEKKILEKVKNPFIVNLEFCFTNPSFVFFAMRFKQGGELYYHLRKK